MADHADPLALFQRLDDVAVDRHAADLFDLAAGDRLAIGDQRQRFQRGAGVLGLALGPQARDPGVHVGLDLEAEAGGELRPVRRRGSRSRRAGLAIACSRLPGGGRFVERKQRRAAAPASAAGWPRAGPLRRCGVIRSGPWIRSCRCGHASVPHRAGVTCVGSPCRIGQWARQLASNASGSLAAVAIRGRQRLHVDRRQAGQGGRGRSSLPVAGASWTISSSCSLASSSTDRKVTTTPSCLPRLEQDLEAVERCRRPACPALRPCAGAR